MDEFQPHFPAVPVKTDTLTDSNQKAIILESLLQELSFWEPSTKKNGKLDAGAGGMRKSRSVNDANDSHSSKSNYKQRNQFTNSTMNGSITPSRGNINNLNRNTFNHQQQHNSLCYDSKIDSADCTTSQVNGDSNYSVTSTNIHITNGGDHHDSNNTTALSMTAPGSPSLAELQALCFWNKAIDPATGRAYYYDIRTRQTQWERVRIKKNIDLQISNCSLYYQRLFSIDI
jgi:hypothetical protein